MTLVGLAVAAVRLLSRERAAPPACAYEVVPALLTQADRSAFGVLEQAIASEYEVLAEVSLADIFRQARYPSRTGWQSAFNRITGEHVDVVHCDPSSLGVVAVIELDDRTHERFERVIRGALVDSALANVRIPVLRVSARQFYSPATIRVPVPSLFHCGERVPAIAG